MKHLFFVEVDLVSSAVAVTGEAMTVSGPVSEAMFRPGQRMAVNVRGGQ